MDQFARMMLACGAPANDDFMILNCKGPVVEKIIEQDFVRLTQFTGSSKVAEHLATVTRGKVRIEDAG